jgi:hypothetical protein
LSESSFQLRDRRTQTANEEGREGREVAEGRSRLIKSPRQTVPSCFDETSIAARHDGPAVDSESPRLHEQGGPQFRTANLQLSSRTGNRSTRSTKERLCLSAGQTTRVPGGCSHRRHQLLAKKPHVGKAIGLSRTPASAWPWWSRPGAAASCTKYALLGLFLCGLMPSLRFKYGLGLFARFVQQVQPGFWMAFTGLLLETSANFGRVLTRRPRVS